MLSFKVIRNFCDVSQKEICVRAIRKLYIAATLVESEINAAFKGFCFGGRVQTLKRKSGSVCFD